MPKKYMRTMRNKRGGFFGTNPQEGNNEQGNNEKGNGFLNSIRSLGSSAFNSVKDVGSVALNTVKNIGTTITRKQPSENGIQNMGPTNQNAGGRRKRMRMRGGYKGWTPLNNLAYEAAPFSGHTARASWVGGRKHKHTKKCRICRKRRKGTTKRRKH